jgi:polysaccharide export outer membrane protein
MCRVGFFKAIGIALLLLAVAGCARELPRQEPVLATPALNAYQLDTGDKVRIVVFEQDSLTGTYEVSSTGKIMMPLIGEVQARGNTVQSLARSVRAKLASGFLRDPDVSAELTTSRPFYIHGEVTRSGAYAFAPGMTMERAIALAGGLTQRADPTVFAVDRLDGTSNQTPVTQYLGLRDAVVPGDTIYVRERLF